MNYPLSPLQQAMLLASVGAASRDLYIVQTVFEWNERIRVSEFEKAWGIIAGRHEILRSTFHWRDTPAPYQRVQQSFDLRVDFHASAGAQPEEKKAALESFLAQDRQSGFSLSDAPPWRVSVLQFADGNTTAVWTFHHLLLDGRSHILLIREMLAIYDSLLTGSADKSTEEIPQSAHVDWLAKQDFSPCRDFWLDYLDQEKVATAIPISSDDVCSAAGHSSHDLWLGHELTHDIKAFAKTEGVSAGNLVQTAWALLLGWLAGENDVTFGAVRACRKSGLPDGGKVIGLVINTLPLRVQWSPESPLRSILRSIAQDWRRFRAYEHTPLQQICKWISLPVNRDLFTTAVSFSADYLPRAVHGDSPGRRNRNVWVRQTVPYCAIDGGFDGDDFHLTISSPNHLVEPSLAGRLPQYVRNALAALVRHPETRAGDLCLLGPGERHRISRIFNTRFEPTPAVHWMQLVSAHAKRLGESVAGESPAGSLSWRQLEEQSNRLARCLLQRGVKRSDLIAVFLPRSPQFIWVCLGIMKAGAAYLPVDIQWPAQRIENVLKDALVKSLVSSRDLIDKIPEPFSRDTIFDAEIATYASDSLDYPAPANGEQLAYVIYTSGSTGLPKGVEIKQAGLQNLIDEMTSRFALNPADRASFISNTAFDASVHEVWPALTAGASVHIPDPLICADPSAMLHWLADTGITFTFLSTVMAEGVLQLNGVVRRGEHKLALRFLLTGGDKLRHVPAQEYSFQLINEYGPTESSVVATTHKVIAGVDAHRNIPIGKPIRGVRAYVVSRLLQLLPSGVPGELLLGGHSLARGYRGQPEMTAAKFIPNPFSEEPATTLYRTGDLVCWSQDGEIQFLGRIDSQVKLRGFRIELGEIESCLLQHSAVAQAVVFMTKSAAQPRILAAVVAKPTAARTGLGEELSAHLRKLMPEYMIPAGYIWREDLPLNTSGKYDRNAIAVLAVQERNDGGSSVDHKIISEAEAKMLAIWEQVLGVSQVKSTDHFLDLGATSLSIIQLICAIESGFGKTVPAAALMSDPRPGDLLELMEGVVPPESQLIVPLKKSGSKPPLFLIPGAGGGVHWFRELAAAMDQDRPMLGLELLSLSAAVQQNFSVVGAAEEIVRTLLPLRDSEPYELSGYSGGGLIALEVAAQLQRRGRLVGAVILIETYPADHLGDTSAKMFRWVRNWLSLPNDKRWGTLLHKVNWYSRQKLRPQAQHSTSRELNAMKERHIQAFISSSVPSYRGKVVIVSAEERPLSVAPDAWNEWERALDTKFEVYRVPGDHYTILNSVNAGPLARRLSQVTNEAEANELTAAR